MPVLVLTARDSWSDKVAGLDAGADDYLAKPFQTEELIARLRALIRRAIGQCQRPSSNAGDIRLDTRSGKVTKAGEPVKLTAQEYKLLSYLMHHKGKVVSRTELIEHIYDQDFDRDSNTIEVFVTRIRKKLGADVITTIRGLGYSLEDSPRLNDEPPGRGGDGGGRGAPARRGIGSLTRRMIGVAALWITVLLLLRRLRARPGADQLDRPQFRQPARICPQRDDRRVRDRARRRGPLQPPAGRPALHRALFGRLFPDQRRRRRHLPVALAVGPAPARRSRAQRRRRPHLRQQRIRRRAAAHRRARRRSCPAREVRWRFQVAQSREMIDEQIRDLRSTLIWSFAVLGAGLLILAALQTFYGLWPLRRVRREVAPIRSGEKTRISEDFPPEIRPLTEEINQLLAHSEEQAEEARRHAGNLAHALKTPLTVITNAATAPVARPRRHRLPRGAGDAPPGRPPSRPRPRHRPPRLGPCARKRVGQPGSIPTNRTAGLTRI